MSETSVRLACVHVEDVDENNEDFIVQRGIIVFEMTRPRDSSTTAEGNIFENVPQVPSQPPSFVPVNTTASTADNSSHPRPFSSAPSMSSRPPPLGSVNTTASTLNDTPYRGPSSPAASVPLQDGEPQPQVLQASSQPSVSTTENRPATGRIASILNDTPYRRPSSPAPSVFLQDVEPQPQLLQASSQPSASTTENGPAIGRTASTLNDTPYQRPSSPVLSVPLQDVEPQPQLLPASPQPSACATGNGPATGSGRGSPQSTSVSRILTLNELRAIIGQRHPNRRSALEEIEALLYLIVLHGMNVARRSPDFRGDMVPCPLTTDSLNSWSQDAYAAIMAKSRLFSLSRDECDGVFSYPFNVWISGSIEYLKPRLFPPEDIAIVFDTPISSNTSPSRQESFRLEEEEWSDAQLTVMLGTFYSNLLAEEQSGEAQATGLAVPDGQGMQLPTPPHPVPGQSSPGQVQPLARSLKRSRSEESISRDDSPTRKKIKVEEDCTVD